MVTTRHSLAVILCLIYVPHITTAFQRRAVHPKRLGKSAGSQEGSEAPGSKLSFKGKVLEEETIATKYGSIVLECEARGIPSPTIHWLKDGVRLEQDQSHSISDDEASFEDPKSTDGRRSLKMSVTHARLFLDCLSDDDEATYSCVAESPMARISQSTNLRLESPDNIFYTDVYECNEKRSSKGEPARIYMWTVARLEFENNAVQLFCRAEGNPKPTIVWFDQNREPIENGDNYRIASNGDLIILDVTWVDNMGTYRCEADNGIGRDTTESFVYPTKR